ncbi:unnamed protein product, partial [Prorocentrum cordatum]
LPRRRRPPRAPGALVGGPRHDAGRPGGRGRDGRPRDPGPVCALGSTGTQGEPFESRGGRHVHPRGGLVPRRRRCGDRAGGLLAAPLRDHLAPAPRLGVRAAPVAPAMGRARRVLDVVCGWFREAETAALCHQVGLQSHRHSLPRLFLVDSAAPAADARSQLVHPHACSLVVANDHGHHACWTLCSSDVFHDGYLSGGHRESHPSDDRTCDVAGPAPPGVRADGVPARRAAGCQADPGGARPRRGRRRAGRGGPEGPQVPALPDVRLGPERPEHQPEPAREVLGRGPPLAHLRAERPHEDAGVPARLLHVPGAVRRGPIASLAL